VKNSYLYLLKQLDPSSYSCGLHLVVPEYYNSTREGKEPYLQRSAVLIVYQFLVMDQPGAEECLTVNGPQGAGIAAHRPIVFPGKFDGTRDFDNWVRAILNMHQLGETIMDCAVIFTYTNIVWYLTNKVNKRHACMHMCVYTHTCIHTNTHTCDKFMFIWKVFNTVVTSVS